MPFNPRTTSSSVDRWDYAKFYKQRDFQSIYDAWEHSTKTLPEGTFIQIFDDSNVLCGWGFTGCYVQTRAILSGPEGYDRYGC